MNRRTISALALCSGLLAATSMVSSARAGNVSWGVSVGGPGFNISASQPGFYGGRGFYGAPFRPWVAPFYRPAFRATVIAPPVAFIPPPVAFSYYAPGPVVYVTRPVVFVRRTSTFGQSSY